MTSGIVTYISNINSLSNNLDYVERVHIWFENDAKVYPLN